MNKSIKIFSLAWILAYLLSGLCAFAQTNTITPFRENSGNTAQPDDVPPTIIRHPQVRMALLLPLNSPALSSAAQAVFAGVSAAYERDGADVKVVLYKSGKQPQDILQAYADAAYENDIVIGPLSRDDVAAVAQNSKISKPTIALAQLDSETDRAIIVPSNMLTMGLSLEDEARQVADWAAPEKKAGQAFIVSTSAAWQQRVANAFAQAWLKLGFTEQSIEIPNVDGYLSASSMEQLKARIQTEKPALIFAALDAQQASQLRLIIGSDVRMVGTSQLNALTLSNSADITAAPEMNGIFLFDMPWQLQPDNVAVMTYPHYPVQENQTHQANLQRLYALGIDAYRIAREIAAQRRNFTLDGVTGMLTIRFGKGAPYFKRTELPAVYRQGNWIPWDATKENAKHDEPVKQTAAKTH